MVISYVLRLHTERALRGDLVGEVEAAASGRRSSIHNVEDLVEFVRQTMIDEEFALREARVERENTEQRAEWRVREEREDQE